MIDIHSHILPAIDDGSKDMEMTLSMLHLSVASGVTDIIATPHVNRGGHIPPWEKIEEKMAQVTDAAAKEHLPIHIYSGAEIELNGDVLRFLKEGSRDYCLAGSPYILLELTDQSQPDIAERMIYELQLRGFWPILAHVERYEQLMNHPYILISWAKKGILLQCNIGSFTGYFGHHLQQHVENLYRNHMVHFLGSDGHRTEFRTTDMRQGQETLQTLQQEQHNRQDLWQDATRNASRILDGRVLYPDVPDCWQVKKKGLWQRLFG